MANPAKQQPPINDQDSTEVNQIRNLPRFTDNFCAVSIHKIFQVKYFLNDLFKLFSTLNSCAFRCL